MCLAAALSAGGTFCPNPSSTGTKISFAFFAAALAGEDDGDHHSRHRNIGEEGRHRDNHGDGAHSEAGAHRSGDSKSRGGPHTGDHTDSRQTSVTYDASRNMVKLHLKLGAIERRDGQRPALHDLHQHESAAWTVGRLQLGGHEPKEMTNVYVRNIAEEKWKEGHSVEALDKSLTPVAARYQSSVFERSSSTTIMVKTKLPIGGLSFTPNEVLAVGMDPASIERAEALGFKADPIMNSESSDHMIVRFTVPPGLDAVRGQDMLSRELPGQRFELNRIYRLYHASAREEPTTLDKNQPATPPGSGSTCAANRCFARELIGWKDTLAPCARGLKVGVIDTDIDEGHPAFAGRHIHRFDFSPDGRSAAPNWHGTAVLSLLAGSPFTGTPGLIPDAEFFAANVFFSDERGEMAADTISLLKALDWMKAFDVKLINMSFSGPRDGLVGDAIERMSESGVVFVAAAGNEGPTAEPSYPAAYPQVIAVTAVTKDLRNYRYANRGNHIDVSSPGVDIWTAAPGGRASYHSGTSFAAPHVTAVLAVEPPETLRQEKADLLDSLAVMDLGNQGRDPVYGRGLLLAPTECTQLPETSETIASVAEAGAPE